MEDVSEKTQEARHEWMALHDLIYLLDAEVRIDLDVTPKSVNRYRVGPDLEIDALAPGARWFGQCDNNGYPVCGTRSAFGNPPYSDVARWIEKAYEETEKFVGSIAVLLVNYDVSTEWYELAKQRCYEIRALSGTPIQIKSESGCTRAFKNSKHECLLIFRKHPENLVCVERSWSWRDVVRDVVEEELPF